MNTFTRLLAVLAALTLVAAACDSSDDAGDEASPPAESSSPGDAGGPTDGIGRADPTAGEKLLTLGDGRLVDEKGFSLYLFTNDDDGVSVCTDGCEATWPPLVSPSGDVPAAAGINGSLIGTIERADGSLQVTFDDHPLYYFSGDLEEGATNGHGSGGVWFLISSEGTAVEA